MKTAYYFKYYWDEPTGEPITNAWGRSTYYIETDEEFFASRQLQIFENGNVLKYDRSYMDDKLGGLAEHPIDTEDFDGEQIDKEQFEALWETSHYRRFPEIVCTPDTLWGQPRLEGTRLAVGDIVSLADGYHEDLNVTLTDFGLTRFDLMQALHYCKELTCQEDQPYRYCHNCLLRVEQFKETIDEDDPEQANWLRADSLFKKYFNSRPDYE